MIYGPTCALELQGFPNNSELGPDAKKHIQIANRYYRRGARLPRGAASYLLPLHLHRGCFHGDLTN